MCDDTPKESEDNPAESTPENIPDIPNEDLATFSANIVGALEKVSADIVGAIQTEGDHTRTVVTDTVTSGTNEVLHNQNNISKGAIDAAKATKKTADKAVSDADVRTAEAERGRKVAEDKAKRTKEESKIQEGTFQMELDRLRKGLTDSETQNDELTTKIGEITEAGRTAVVAAKDQMIEILEDCCKAGEKRETTLKDEAISARTETIAAKDQMIEILGGQLTEGQTLVGDIARNAHNVQKPEFVWPKVVITSLWFIAGIILLAFLLSFVTGVVSTTQASWVNNSAALGTSEVANAVPTETPSTVSPPSSDMGGSTLPLRITGDMVVDSIDINAGADERLKEMQNNR